MPQGRPPHRAGDVGLHRQDVTPLIITEEDADKATEILEKQITTVEKKFL